ncbi:cytochrome c [Jatrophihabitans telluris]|uniref:Cytochrome bc1 complex cytochrome c subunit n=1 Tax=Jatrophihabitans telluris TaxID=2038343 RepID=A0ABY4QU85_9ACTN|nr:cytochrome c [Jatrophihabitans telluris]UQX87251.1 cytochrome c [Jatrophihabitans telluris]
MTDDNVDADSGLGFEPAVTDGTFAAAEVGRSRPRTATGSRRRNSLRRRLTSLVVLTGALVTVGGGYALLAPSSSADQTAVSAADVEHGRQLFQTSCITCHGANLQGVTGRGPSLIGVGSAATYFQVSTGRMPAVSQGANNVRKPAKFGEADTQALAAFVGSVGGGPEAPTSGSLRNGSIGAGGELFRLNCASCHNFAGKGAPLSAGKVAPGLNQATDKQIYTAMLSGPENMPVFSDNQITPEQKQAIINYIQNLKASKDPGGAGLDRIGPVSEGLLIWTVGLGVLMVAILWIGRKS